MSAGDRFNYDQVPDIGLLYDSVPLYAARNEAAFYGSFAAKAGGEVLEIGCGTGRVLLPIARAGHRVTGLDSADAMLDRLRERLALESAETRGRVHLVHADARAFALERAFALIIAPFRVFQHMVTIEDQLRFLENVRHHLAPGGRFVFDVFNPRFDLLARDRSEEAEDTPETPMADGRTLRRTARIVRVRWLEQVSEVELIWYVKDREGRTQRLVQSFDMRWYTKAELEHLLARQGFRVVETYGALDRSPLVEGAPELILVCERAASA